MIIKKKNYYTFVVLALLGVIVSMIITILFGTSNQLSASAASSPNKLSPMANYTMSRYVDGEVIWNTQGKASTWRIVHSEGGGTTYTRLSIMNQITQPYHEFVNGVYGKGLEFQDVSIEFTGNNLNQILSLSDASGNVIAHHVNNGPINVTLDEGEYYVNLTAYPNPWTRKDGKEEYYLLEAEFCFHIDLSDPYLLGAFPEGEEQWVGIGHTVEAKDDVTWIDDFYTIQPDGNFVRFPKEQRSYTFQAGDKEGLYKFSACDDVGHPVKRSVLFDGTAPNGIIKTEDDKTIESGGIINQGFSFIATDELSGIKSIDYKTPNADDWKEYVAGTMIPNNSPLGKYEFRCKDKANNEAIYTVNLSHDFASQITAPTCTTGGFTTFVCNDCGYHYIGDYVSELGHSYSDTRVASTCTEKGFTLHQCVRCDKSYQDTPVRELGHDMQPSTILPSCTDSGYLIYSCTRCDETIRTETSKPLGHNYTAKTVAATCLEGGYTIHECSRCGDIYKDNISQPLGHNYVISTLLPTCTEFGKTQYACQVCGDGYAVQDGTYPTGHSYTITVIKEPTCTKEGIRQCICDNCGDSYEVIISAHGHNYSIVEERSSSNKITRIYSCSECGSEYRQELGDQYEEVSNYVEYLFEKYEPYMWWVLLASAGMWSIVMGVFFAIAQKNEDKEKARRMLINYCIGLVVIAVIVVACPFLIRGIAALVT